MAIIGNIPYFQTNPCLLGLIGSYWLPIDVCFSNSFFHSRQPAAPALFFLAFLTCCPLSFSGGLCFLVRMAPILQQALQFLSLEPSAQAVLANSSGLCVYLEQLARPWCLTGQTNQVPSGTTSKQNMPKTGIPRRVYDVFSYSVLLLLGFVYQSSHGWVLMLVLLMMVMGGNTIINTPHWSCPKPSGCFEKHQTSTNQAKSGLK